MKVYRTTKGIVLQSGGKFYLIEESWDHFITNDSLFRTCEQIVQNTPSILDGPERIEEDLLKPISGQEVWAAGVTYFNSKLGRQEEAEAAGGGDFYERVYHADRPEIFFKATAARTVGHLQKVAIRSDSTWDVPEPELTLCISPSGKIVGYTIGNDMSSRSIEGENPLYLPQAKTYDRSAALGPCIWVLDGPFPKDALISMEIERKGALVFSEQIGVDKLVRNFEDLVSYLYRHTSFPQGCFLMTGTGIVPEASFSLKEGDVISISISGIGVLRNTVG